MFFLLLLRQTNLSWSTFYDFSIFFWNNECCTCLPLSHPLRRYRVWKGIIGDGKLQSSSSAQWNAPRERNAHQVSFEWFHFRFYFADSIVGIINYIIKNKEKLASILRLGEYFSAFGRLFEIISLFVSFFLVSLGIALLILLFTRLYFQRFFSSVILCMVE